MMTLRNKLYATASIPSALGIAALYAATIATDSDDSKWLFRMGMTLVVTTVILARLTWISYHHRLMEDWVHQLNAKIHELETDQDLIRQDVESHLIVKAWSDAGLNSDAVRRRSMRLVPKEN